MAKKNVLWRALEYAGHAETIHTIAQAEFVRTLLLPTAVSFMTGAAGILGGVPLMWVIMATALAFAGTMQGILRGSEYLERKNPLNKLKPIGPHFAFDLNPATIPAAAGNRHQRRAGSKIETARTLGANEISPQVKRTLNRAQIGWNLRNDASFPISFIVQSAESRNYVAVSPSPTGCGENRH